MKPTDRGRVTEEAERLRREAEAETARKRREVEEAERKRRETEEAERKRREAEGADHEHLEVKHNNDHHNDHRTTRRAFLRDDARPEVPQRGHHQVALVKATPSHFRPHTASDEDLQNIHDI